MKTYTIGDIHGQYEALIEVLTKAKFDYDKDKLIVLGDVVDGGINTYKCVEELLKIKNIVYVLGNHDEWFMKHISNGFVEEIWIQQGGANTLRSYGAIAGESEYATEPSYLDLTNVNIPVTHQDFFNRGVYYHIENKMCFVHGGFDSSIGIEKTSNFTLLWDRELIQRHSRGREELRFDKIFVGHTTTQQYNTLEPVKFGKLWMMDTGAGWNGKLTIMNVNTEEHWQSKLQVGGR